MRIQHSWANRRGNGFPKEYAMLIDTELEKVTSSSLHMPQFRRPSLEEGKFLHIQGASLTL
jgi:hypothetical protein